jgi:predicted MPP superfamily phosphohydrolase
MGKQTDRRPGAAPGGWTVLATLLALAVLCLGGCATPPPRQARPAGEPGPWPAARFAVLSDPHVMEPARDAPRPIHDIQLQGGMKLLGLSGALLDQAVNRVLEEPPRFVVVTGDLTERGDRASHQSVAMRLERLSAAGIAVYVVPGNHDIANPAAGTQAVTPEEFTRIYEGLGYAAAVSWDPASLSYAAEPVPGLRIIAVDSCRYRENREAAVSSGRIAEATFTWLSLVLDDARIRGDRVIVFLHHAVLEHFQGQADALPAQLLLNHAEAARFLAAQGVSLVLSGHGHAQDAAMAVFAEAGGGGQGIPVPPGGSPSMGERFLIDLETGATVSYPHMYRVLDLDRAGRLSVRSRSLTPWDGAPGLSLASSERLARALASAAEGRLQRAGVSPAAALVLGRRFSTAGMEFFRGDETGAGAPADITGFDFWAAAAAGQAERLARGLGTDLPPADNGVDISLEDGSWAPAGARPGQVP